MKLLPKSPISTGATLTELDEASPLQTKSTVRFLFPEEVARISPQPQLQPDIGSQYTIYTDPSALMAELQSHPEHVVLFKVGNYEGVAVSLYVKMPNGTPESIRALPIEDDELDDEKFEDDEHSVLTPFLIFVNTPIANLEELPEELHAVNVINCSKNHLITRTNNDEMDRAIQRLVVRQIQDVTGIYKDGKPPMFLQGLKDAIICLCRSDLISRLSANLAQQAPTSLHDTNTEKGWFPLVSKTPIDDLPEE